MCFFPNACHHKSVQVFVISSRDGKRYSCGLEHVGELLMNGSSISRVWVNHITTDVSQLQIPLSGYKIFPRKAATNIFY